MRKRARATAVVAAALVAALGAGACGPSQARPTSQPWALSLFRAGNVGAWPLDASSAAYAADIVADYKADYGAVGVNTLPIYIVPASQPDVTVSVTPGCSDFLASTGAQVPVPAFTALNGSSDNPLVVYQPSTGSDWEFWQAARHGDGTYSACWGGKLDVFSSNGVFPSPYGLSATGISYLATAITGTDIASGHIDHTLALQLPRCEGFVYPADRGDCGSDPGQPPEGEWFRLPRDLAMPAGLPPFAQMVFTALQHYGAVFTDQAGGVMVEAEQPGDWAAEGHRGTDPITASWGGLTEYQVLAQLPWTELQAVVPPRS